MYVNDISDVGDKCKMPKTFVRLRKQCIGQSSTQRKMKILGSERLSNLFKKWH